MQRNITVTENDTFILIESDLIKWKHNKIIPEEGYITQKDVDGDSLVQGDYDNELRLLKEFIQLLLINSLY